MPVAQSCPNRRVSYPLALRDVRCAANDRRLPFNPEVERYQPQPVGVWMRPHRDDLLLMLDGREARAYGSQGQQRTAVVSLKLAEAALVARRTGERPVLLLDDVLSELDGERRAALLRQVAGEGQVIITSVEAGPFPPELMSTARVWSVAGGEIQACG